jgi:hypothetical protein
MFAALRFISVQICAKIANPTQLSEVGGGYVENGMVSFHILT